MGSGQSKFGKNNRRSQIPYGGGQGYPGPYGPPQSFAPYPQAPGYGHPVYPQQGFMPPGPQFGQGAFMPPPQLNWLPQDKQFKKRKSRRTHSERFPGGFAISGGQPQESAPRRRSESHRRDRVDAPVVPPSQPSATAQGHNSRAPTPFMPPFPRDDEEDDDEYEEDRPRSAAPIRAASRQSTSRYPVPPPIRADLAHVIEPLEPASSAAFGPSGPRPRRGLSNPLPPPPRDLYEMTPYKQLLNLPQTTALLTATYGPQHATLSTTALGPQPSVNSKKGKGLFRAFSRKDKHKDPEPPQVRFIPVFVDNQNQPQSATSGAGAGLGRSQSQMSHQSHQPSVMSAGPPGSAGLPSGGLATGTTFGGMSNASPTSSTEPGIAPVPPIPSSPPAIRFDQSSRYVVFMNHSPHRVIWHNLEYPTALHLHEALKFLGHRPDLAEKIRNCKDIQDVYPLSASFQQFQRQDWGQVYLDLLKDVLLCKFKQHPDLRMLLMQTGTARIIYVDADDVFWGSGAHGNGQNQLGQALVEVRQRLFAEAPTAMGA